ncbi:microtubule-associated protein RP/EB family member 1 [Anopheles darlingi]|uniref:Microtubule-associated protein RP/EB family member 1 n=1 Tax=Anopheles darlingi TaxID=43151 RepID=W5JB97_ANODA|nr:microtubule-associated protein RP/EB family member 1-like [Anopheles darlingi]ETN61271.1 microtubule-associated protein RP/EB family member 1 [Anopheles darlingi]
MAVNVHFTGQTTENLSRVELLAWVNRTLLSEFKKVEELCTGAAYCQLMDVLFPGSVPLKRIKYCTNVEHDFLSNLRLFQNALVHLKVNRSVPIDRLVKGRFQDNFEFLQWFKKFFDANYDGKEYDPQAARNNAPMGYGTPGTLKPSQRANIVGGGHRPLHVGIAQKTIRSRSGDSNGSGEKAVSEKQPSKATETINALASEIDDLTVQMQRIEMSRDYYYQKLAQIEAWMQEHGTKENEAFCEKVVQILSSQE